MLKKISAALSICLWAMVGGVWSQGLPDTGQKKCYDSSGAEITCPQPGEAFYGQDAEYVKARSYTDLGNGTVRDNVTGLEWQQVTAPGTYTWQQALDYCATLSLGGHDDWRLPSIEELSTLEDSSISSPGPTINTHYFPDTVASSYWSSTTHAVYTDYAWIVHFYNGLVFDANKGGRCYVRAVRGGP